ncbi:MAG: hypothetical protein JXR71_00705 [Bacteroidales bacterium]|nr:hypothetical protein [Bacteroidales bacterium]
MGKAFRKVKYVAVITVGILLMLGISVPEVLQGQTVKESKKETKSKVVVPRSPTKATLWALIPGGGQIYNHKYWKIPIVYAGFAVIGYTAVFNTREYTKYRDAYNCVVSDSACTNPLAIYQPYQLKTVRDYYRRNMQLSYIVMGAWYILQMIDANVDAQFTHWNVSDNLSMDVYPIIKQPTVNRQTPSYNGVTLRFNF